VALGCSLALKAEMIVTVPVELTVNTTVEPAAMVCDCGCEAIAGAPVAWTARTPPLLVIDPPVFVTVTL
jgi:hypothetical protein